jgi:hypothetical protein
MEKAAPPLARCIAGVGARARPARPLPRAARELPG